MIPYTPPDRPRQFRELKKHKKTADPRGKAVLLIAYILIKVRHECLRRETVTPEDYLDFQYEYAVQTVLEPFA